MQPKTGGAALARVRAGFALQGKTLTSWCRENGVTRQNARLAIIGAWDGPKSRAMRGRIFAAAGVDQLPGQ